MPEATPKTTSRGALAPYALFGALISTLLGYDLGIIGAAIDSLKEYMDLTDMQLEGMVGGFTLSAAFASPIGGILSDYMGRRKVLGGSAFVATIGATVMTFATNYPVLLAGRIIEGIGVGAGISQAPTYLVELAAAAERGQVVALLEVYLNVGIFLGFLAGKLTESLGTPTNFRVMFGISTVPALFVSIVVPFMPESPRWLVRQGREEEARKALLSSVSVEEAQQTMVEITHEFEEQMHGPTFTQEMASPWFLRSLGIALGMAFTFAYSGIDTITYYSSIILEQAGATDESLRASSLVMLGIVKTVTIIAAVILLDRVGRRTMLMLSFAGMSFSMLAMVVPGVQFKIWELCLVGSLFFASFFSMGMGPGFYLVTAEIWPTKHRAKGVSLVHTARSLHCSCVQLGFLWVADHIGYGPTMSIFGVMSFVGLAFVYYGVPETKGRTLEQILNADDRRPSLIDDRNPEVLVPDKTAIQKEEDDAFLLGGPESDHPPP